MENQNEDKPIEAPPPTELLKTAPEPPKQKVIPMPPPVFLLLQRKQKEIAKLAEDLSQKKAALNDLVQTAAVCLGINPNDPRVDYEVDIERGVIRERERAKPAPSPAPTAS